jgi:hypothetical protein
MVLIPDGPDTLYCPDWRKLMSKVCKTCPLWMSREITTTRIADNKVEKSVEWMCGKALAVLSQAEIIDNQHKILDRLVGSQSATESMRNEIVRRMDNVTPDVPGQLDALDVINSRTKLIGGH